jgi:hypothetical protein
LRKASNVAEEFVHSIVRERVCRYINLENIFDGLVQLVRYQVTGDVDISLSKAIKECQKLVVGVRGEFMLENINLVKLVLV